MQSVEWRPVMMHATYCMYREQTKDTMWSLSSTADSRHARLLYEFH